jgi:hypothetical protein
MSITHIRKRYLWKLAATFIGAIIATGLINLIIDPYGTFRIVDIKGLNHIKPYPDHDIETIKSQALRHMSPDALILGNSRAEVGFDPNSSTWATAGYRSVYNAGVPGSLPGSAWNFVQIAERVKPPKLILLGIDFFDFPIAPNFKPIQQSSNIKSNLVNALWLMRATLTSQALLDSATTIRRQYQNKPEQLTPLGHNPLLEYEDFAKADGYWVLFRQRAEENAKNHGRKPKNLYLNGTQSSPHFDNIRHIVRWAVQNNAELRLVVYPYHAQLLVLIDELGLWPIFDEWKRQIVRIIDEEQPIKNDHITVIDFSGFSTYATELIPPKNDKQTITQWYWEAGHFKKELGNLMLQKILLPNTNQSLASFGTKITQQNIDTHTLAILAKKVSYLEKTPEITSELREIILKNKDNKQ